jgi:DNA-directed RNA polymerase subunit K/omega
MSDDEGGEDYGEYEAFGVGDEPVEEEGLPDLDGDGLDDIEADADVEGLDEDAAGTDDEDEEEEDSAEDEEAEPLSQKARPERAKVDPVLRMANKSRTVQVVAPEDRVTDNRLHRSEAAYIISMRAQQIARSATCFTEGGDLHDPVALAFKELLERRCPFILRRPVGFSPSGDPLIEEWAVREMTLPPLTPPVPLGSRAGNT